MNKTYQKIISVVKNFAGDIFDGLMQFAAGCFFLCRIPAQSELSHILPRVFFHIISRDPVSRRGFTLLELLTVVLIIGILSAAALPRYQTAVAKSRLASVIPVVRNLKEGQELIFLSAGAYEVNGESLEGSLPAGCTALSAGRTTCGRVKYDIGFTNDPDMFNVLGMTDINGYLMYYDHSGLPGRIECLAVSGNKTARRVCESMGGEKTGTWSGLWTGPVDRYRL